MQLVVQHKESRSLFETHLLDFYRQFGGTKAYQHTAGMVAQQATISPQCTNVAQSQIQPQTLCNWPPPSAQLSVAQEPEQYSYWCGPATGAVILNADNFRLGPRGEYLYNDSTNSDDYANERALTHYLGWYGTNWSQQVPNSNPPTYYSPMASMLNAWISGGTYYVVNGSGVGNGFTTSTFAYDVETDITTGWAVAGGMSLEPGDGIQYIPGYPTNIVIQHWIPIIGFSSYGSTILFDDPIYHSPDPNLQWHVAGPTASISASWLAQILNTRGYIW